MNGTAASKGLWRETHKKQCETLGRVRVSLRNSKVCWISWSQEDRTSTRGESGSFPLRDCSACRMLLETWIWASWDMTYSREM